MRLLAPFARILRRFVGRVRQYTSLLAPGLRTNGTQHPPFQAEVDQVLRYRPPTVATFEWGRMQREAGNKALIARCIDSLRHFYSG